MEIKKLTFFFVNTYLIRGEKTALFDTGAVVEPANLPEFLKQNDVDPKEIDIIILSHAHWDHIQLAKAWKDLTGAKILCHKNTVDYISTGKKDNPFIYGAKAKACPPFIEFMDTTCPPEIEPVIPDIVIGDEDYDLHSYGIPGKIIYTPGHADSAISLVLDDRVAFIGDTVFDLHTVGCLADKYPDGSLSLNWICHDEESLKNSVRRLLKEADVFHGGHCMSFDRNALEELL